MDGDPALELAGQLIACRSITPHDGGCLDLIAGRLEKAGFICTPITRGGVRNLWARRGDCRPLVCLAGHIDVVPSGPAESWHSAPFTPTQRDGKLYGRGAADMKGAVAAMVRAAEDFVVKHPAHRGSIAFLLTSDEEGEAIDGTRAVVDWLIAQGERIDYCVVGEPSSTQRLGDIYRNGRRGSLSAKLIIKGIQGHVAYPELVRNPIHMAATLIAEMAAIRWDSGNAHFPPTTWQVSNIGAGTGADNVVPGHIDVRFNFRFGTASTPESLQASVENLLERHGLDYEIFWTVGAYPFLSEGDELADVVRAAIRETTGEFAQPSTAGGTSDGRFIRGICPQIVEFGPLNASAHKIDEHIDITDLTQLTRIYGRILEHLLT